MAILNCESTPLRGGRRTDSNASTEAPGSTPGSTRSGRRYAANYGRPNLGTVAEVPASAEAADPSLIANEGDDALVPPSTVPRRRRQFAWGEDDSVTGLPSPLKLARMEAVLEAAFDTMAYLNARGHTESRWREAVTMLKERAASDERGDIFHNLEANEVTNGEGAIRQTSSWRTVQTFFNKTFTDWAKHAAEQANISGNFAEKAFFTACNDEEARLTKIMQDMKQGMRDHKEREAAARTPATEQRLRFKERVVERDVRAIRAAAAAMRDAHDPSYAEDSMSRGRDEDDDAEGEDEDEAARPRKTRGPGRRGATTATAAQLEESVLTMTNQRTESERIQTQLAVERHAHQMEMEKRQMDLEERKVQQEDRRIAHQHVLQSSMVDLLNNFVQGQGALVRFLQEGRGQAVNYRQFGGYDNQTSE